MKKLVAFFAGMPIPLLLLLLGFVLSAYLGFGMIVLGYGDYAMLVVNMWNLLIVTIALLYVVLIHSRKRWPDANIMVRLGRTLTFYRG